MFSNHVGFDMNTGSRPRVAQSGVSQRVLDQRQLHAARLDVVDGETYAVHRYRAVQNEQRLEGRRNREIDNGSVTVALDGSDCADAVDVALDDVSAETIADPHRSFEVDPGSLLPITDRGSLERRSDGGRGEPPGSELANGETRAVDGDALASGEVRKWRTDAKLARGIRLPRVLDFADLFDQSGEHFYASRSA